MPLLNRQYGYQRSYFAFAVFAAVWAILLLYAGAYTTSIQAGMAFLDWPLSNSSINPEGWLTNEAMAAEHSHRLLGAKLGLLAIGMVVWTQLRAVEGWRRGLAWGLLGMVVFQGLLGGLRVLLDQLNTGWDNNVVAQTFAVLHACGAQATVCLLVANAATNSRVWLERNCGLAAPVPPKIRRLGWLAVGAIFIQILLGAVMRHAHAGLAIPTFPLTPEGSLFPAHWSFPITINWLHRAWAIVVTIHVAFFLGKVLGTPNTRKPFGWLAWLVCGLLAVQIFLGAATIWTHKNPVMASNHMVFGAFLLAATWLLTLCTCRLPLEQKKSVLAPKQDAKATPAFSETART